MQIQKEEEIEVQMKEEEQGRNVEADAQEKAESIIMELTKKVKDLDLELKKVKQAQKKMGYPGMEYITCWNCNKQGHKAYMCKMRKDGGKKENVKKGQEVMKKYVPKNKNGVN